jgi:hypothetical protein
MSLPVAASQTRAILSSLAVTTRVRSCQAAYAATDLSQVELAQRQIRVLAAARLREQRDRAFVMGPRSSDPAERVFGRGEVVERRADLVVVVAVTPAECSGERDRRLLRSALCDAGCLRAMRVPWTCALARVLDAGAALATGTRARGVNSSSWRTPSSRLPACVSTPRWLGAASES